MSFLFINKIFQLNNLKTRAAINAKISVIFISAEAIIYLLLYNLHDCTFKGELQKMKTIVSDNFSWKSKLLETMPQPFLEWRFLFFRNIYFNYFEKPTLYVLLAEFQSPGFWLSCDMVLGKMSAFASSEEKWNMISIKVLDK